MGPKQKRGLLGALRYDSEEDEDYNPQGGGAARQHQPGRKRRKAARQAKHSPATSEEEEADRSDSDETLAQRQQRLAASQQQQARSRRPNGSGGSKPRQRRQQQQQRQQQPPAAGWDSLPLPLLSKVFRAVCGQGALPMAPCLACVCTTWAAAVAESPELWRVLDTSQLPPRAAKPAGAPQAPARRKQPAAGSSSSGGGGGRGAQLQLNTAAVDEGLSNWTTSGRLSQLRELRVCCAGSSDGSSQDPLSAGGGEGDDDEEKQLRRAGRGSAAAAAGAAGLAAGGSLSGGGGSCVGIQGSVLMTLAHHCRQLQRLTLTGSPGFRPEALTAALLSMTSLQRLELSQVRMSPVAGLDAGLRRWLGAAAETGRSPLTHLVLEQLPLIGRQTLKGLCQPMIRQQQQQQQSSEPPGSAGMPAAAAPLAAPAFPHLQLLDLSCSCSAVGGSGVELQLELLQAGMPELQVLKLSGLGGIYGWQASFKATVPLPGFRRLHTLHVGCAMMQLPSGFTRMGGWKSARRRVAGVSEQSAGTRRWQQNLPLVQCRASAQTAAAPPTLVLLLHLPNPATSPGSSNVRDATLLALAGKSPLLRDLDVSGTHVTATGLAALADAQAAAAAAAAAAAGEGAGEGAGSGNVQPAAAPAAQVADPGGARLRLQSLCITRCAGLATDGGLEQIALLCSGQLQELVVQNAGSSLGDAGLRALASCMRLSSLDISGCSATETGLRDLLSALPDGSLQDILLSSCRSLGRSTRQAAAAGLVQLRRSLGIQ